MPSSGDAEIQSPIDEEPSSNSSDEPKNSPEEEGDGSFPDDGEDANDTCQKIESEGHEGDLTSVRSSLEKAEAIPVSECCSVENAGGDNISVHHSNELPETHPIDEDVEPLDSGSPLISDNGTPESADDINNTMIQKENTRSSEALENVQNNKEVHCVIEPSVADDTLTQDCSRDSEPDSVMYSDKAMKSPLRHTTLQSSVDFKLNSPSAQTPRQRPRSESLDADEFEKINKRPVMVCEFFAKGWCIKGKSCRFLHQKDGVDTAGQWAKGELNGASLRGDSQEIAGLSLDSAVRKEAISIFDSSKLHFHQFHENNEKFSVQREDLSSGVLQRRDIQPFSLARDDPRLDSTVTLNRQDPSPFLTVREDSKVYGRSFEVPSLQEKHLHDKTFDRGSLARNNSIPHYRFFSAGPSSSLNMYGNYADRLPPDRNSMDAIILKRQTHFSLYDSHSSSIPNSSLNTTFSMSLQSAHIFPSHLSSGLPGSLSTRGSSPLSTGLVVGPKLLESDAEYSVTGSTALKPGSSFPSFLGPETDHLPVSGRSKTYSYSNSWEPSIPFQSSFVCPSASLSSPGSQYDPLLDSIEPPNGGKEKYIHNFSPERTNGDHVITGERGLHPPRQSHGNLLDLDFYRDGVYVPTVPEKEHTTSISKEERGWSSGHPETLATASEMGLLDVNLTQQTEWGRGVKDSKTLKYFRAALVDFVKDMVKPFWRDGHLSKDAHKMIVKKAVDKVLSTLQPHQVPSTPESVNKYLSSSRPKLAKLVEGYVDRFKKE